MQLTAIILTAVGLAMDAFAVAMASSVVLGKVSPRQIFRFGFHFGLFQAMMPVMGWLSGQGVRQYIQSWDHWVAFGLLALIGVKAIYEALRSDEEDDQAPSDPTRGLKLVTLSVATSIDAFAVGLSFALTGVDIWYPAVMIGVVTAALTTVGMLIGSRVGSWFGRPVEILGGLVLIGIGVKILMDHAF